ncbi:MAG: FAD-binding protein [Candidatus Pacebacteria bacterium]|nr:FAD-binding protein [Candidatus Paceibacterota bacterium]
MSIKVQKNILLSKYTTFKIGGPAKFFCVVENIDEIRETFKFAEKNKLKIFILGEGSNILISDKGFDGFVLKIQDTKYKIQTNNKIFVGSGLSLAKLVSESVKNNLTGLQWAAGMPGAIGGAIVNNAGASGMSMMNIVEEVEILEIITQPPLSGGISFSPDKGRLGGIRRLTNKQCKFSYRNSIFKEEKKYIILNAVLKLKKGNEEKSRKMISEILKSRKEKQPFEYPSAGSIFKNPVLDDNHLRRLIKENSELENISKNNTIPAGWFIENLGLKGKKIGGAMISEKHGNFIVNMGNAKAENVIILISLIKQKVRDNFSIQLKEEIEYVGF